MHLRIIAAILCLSLVLVQAGNYGPRPDNSIIYRHIQPSRVVVIHHHHGGRGGGSSGSSSGRKGKGSGSNSSGNKKRKYRKRYRRATEDLDGGSSNRSSLED